MDVFEALSEARTEGRQAVLVTVVGVEGDPPSRPGAKLAVVAGCTLAGTLGCSEFDAAGRELAVDLAGEKEPTASRRVVYSHDPRQAVLLFAERYEPAPAVVVVGSTAVGRFLADFVSRLGRRVVYLPDDADPAAALGACPPGPRDAVVLTDHDAPYVTAVLKLALGGDVGFVGMLGSRRHAPDVLARLRAGGIPEEQVARLHTPCGLDIGSVTPAEIALSIAAEIVAAERGRSGGSLRQATVPLPS